jgi:ribonucleoside-triphosphate reductase
MAMDTARLRLMPTFVLLDADFNSEMPTYFSGCNRVPGPAVGRGNVASVTINLPRLALKAHRDPEAFFKNLDRALELAVFQLSNRLELLGQLKAKDLPFIMGQKLYEGSEDLHPSDSILPSLTQGTLSVGFIGLAETLVALTGKHHGEGLASMELGKQILTRMRTYIDQVGKELHLNLGLYASQADSISGRLVRLDQHEFGLQPGVTDKPYYTNSFHLPPSFSTDTKTKLDREAPFHGLCNHGHITLFELASIDNEQIEQLIHQALEAGCGHVAFNFPNDHCLSCGWVGKSEGDCPNCHSQDLHFVRRLSGYLAPLDRFTEAKRAELGDRHAQVISEE